VQCSETAARGLARGGFMLDERQTLMILGWALGTLCVGTLLMSALSLA
jgi:hypothetical protein